MRLAEWVARLADRPPIAELLDALEAHCVWHAVCPEARAVLLGAAYGRRPRPMLVVAPNYDRALAWQARLALSGIPSERIRLLPSGQSALFEDAAPEIVALSDRIGALRFLASGEPGVVVATAQAAVERTLPRDVLVDSFFRVAAKETHDPVRLAHKLVRLGYEPAEPVRVPGQFSRRGGILDVFPMGADRPARIEFFGDEIDSLRSFDPNSQRSLGALPELVVAASRETLVPTDPAALRSLIEHALEGEAAALPPDSAAKLEELVRGDIQALAARVFFDRLDLYRPLIQPESGCAVDLLSEGGLLVLDDPLEVASAAERAEEELADALTHRAARGEILHATALDFALPAEHFASAPNLLALSALDPPPRDDSCMRRGAGGWSLPDWLPTARHHHLATRTLEPYRGHPLDLTNELQSWLKSDWLVLLSTDQPNRAKAMLAQVEIHPRTEPEDETGLHLAEGNLAGGFALPEIGLAVLTDHELFGVGRLKLPQRRFNQGVPVATVLDLAPGDFVVHINFGVGIYRGLVKRMVDKVEKEFLYIEYKAPDKLFVPADQLDRVQKYLAPSDDPPKINRLSGGEWQRTVGKARAEAREMARELIQLYASRKAAQRPSYGPDTPWQGEMEATFPWVETPSQLEAIHDVKRDLQTDYPMDRLVCGDVGFGKTEVAVRAAFRVAQAGRQVAVLCPTTILSEQHHRSFSERLAAFPIRLDYLNRFRTARDREDIKRRLSAGEIDVIIGTHALLSEELKFKDLGLLIVDEEQKFGVKHKESLKKLRVNVDVLSMSATPIPRTLGMALMSIRNMSVINDPPPGRLPIRTYVRPFASEVVREALQRELARGGQVYYVYNRIDGIYHILERLKTLVPHARIAVGHGQMSEKELEPVMLGFIRGEIDILLSTTIVESGLDIPNANTLVVENADRFGLSQLYQLRGRVGRSDRQAYAYLLYDGKRLTEGANARLQALAEFSQLGSGYALAFRDLQIRGAGDLLGAKQSGQMAAVGYELYAQLIDAEVQFLKEFADGSPSRPELADPLEGLTPLPPIDLPVAALIPESVISDQAQRLFYYKLMMSARNGAELEAAWQEMSDRYGRLPAEVIAAFAIMRARLRARDLGVKQMDGKGGRIAVDFVADSPVTGRVVSQLTKRHREAYMAQDRLIWPFAGSSVAACEALLDAMEAALAAVEAQKSAVASASRGG